MGKNLDNLLLFGFSPVTSGINNYIYAWNLYSSGLNTKLEGDAYLYYTYLTAEIETAKIFDSDQWCGTMRLVLVIESKNQDGCRVFKNCVNLLDLKNLILQNITRLEEASKIFEP
ncbi:Hypothetical protein CINCED_3A002119 [Cinara cedri]|uniref:Uncharacterized protein n=1 Tax=Cinara cedri TaxID=506608 RepID=A0A5E4NKZ3_9HEMI|nr:Hypothetical protein CINCED_3A002119 [Cinara cedri]